MNILNRIVGGLVGAVTGAVGESARTAFRWVKMTVDRVWNSYPTLHVLGGILLPAIGVGILVADLCGVFANPMLFMLVGYGFAVPAAITFGVPLCAGLMVGAARGLVHGARHGASVGITGFDGYFFRPSEAPYELSLSFQMSGDSLRDKLNSLTPEDKARFTDVIEQKFIDCATEEVMTHPVTLRVKEQVSDGEELKETGNIIDDATIEYASYRKQMETGSGKGYITRTQIVGIVENRELQSELKKLLENFQAQKVSAHSEILSVVVHPTEPENKEIPSVKTTLIKQSSSASIYGSLGTGSVSGDPTISTSSETAAEKREKILAAAEKRLRLLGKPTTQPGSVEKKPAFQP